MKWLVPKKSFFFWSFFILFFVPLNAYEDKQRTELDPEEVDRKNVAIHTYGGGESLGRVFRAISMLIYGNSKLVLGRPLEAFFGLP